MSHFTFYTVLLVVLQWLINEPLYILHCSASGFAMADSSKNRIIQDITIPKFAISQSKANSTVLISYDMKSLTWFCYCNAKFWAEFGYGKYSFGLAMGTLARLRLAKIPTMARPNSPDMPPKRTKKVRLGICINKLKLNTNTHHWQ